jgi:ketosteroid isomerase-like protein
MSFDDELRTTLDELAVRRVTATYCDAANRLAAPEAAATYAPDGSLSMMGRPEVSGREAVEAMLEATFSRYELVTQLTHSGLVQIDGDVAASRWVVTELQVARTGERRFIIGRYEDQLVRLGEGWRFARRVFTARYVGPPDLGGEVAPDVPVRFPFEP